LRMRDRIGVKRWWVVRMRLHHVHRVLGICMMLGRRRMSLKVCNMRSDDLVFPFMLQFR